MTSTSASSKAARPLPAQAAAANLGTFPNTYLLVPLHVCTHRKCSCHFSRNCIETWVPGSTRNLPTLGGRNDGPLFGRENSGSGFSQLASQEDFLPSSTTISYHQLSYIQTLPWFEARSSQLRTALGLSLSVSAPHFLLPIYQGLQEARGARRARMPSWAV